MVRLTTGGGWNPSWQPNTAPTITSLRPTPGSIVSDRTPTIAARVRDAQSELLKLNITLTVDDVVILRASYTYDTATDRLAYTPVDRMSYGWHSVVVKATTRLDSAPAGVGASR